MARAKKEAALTPEERLQAALVPDWEWPYKLPKNWCWTRIGMVSNFERGITFPAAAKEAAPTEDNIPCLRTANVQENLEIDDMIYVNRDFMKGNIAKLVRENDIIMSSANSRELVGKSSLVTHIPFPMTFGGFVLNIRAKEMSSKYLFYFLRHEFLAGKFIGESSQTTNIANINTTTLGNYEIPLPPLPEQQRIVDRIESLFAKLDEAKEKAQAVVDSFEARKAAILHKAFTGELTAKWREEHGVRMESWEKHLLSTVSSLQTGLMKGKKYTGKTVELPYLRVANVQDGFLRLDEIKKIDVEENAISRYSLAVGDVLFTKEVNEKYLRNCDIAFSDPKKEEALKYAFVNSRVLLVYGAAGTGKTTLIDMIPTMLSGRRKLFLTKTHTALQNLQRRINNPGADASFVSINSFTKRVNLPDYDVIFVDECSTIDNRAMKVFLEKMRPDTFLVLAGDTYQIESIDFGNWFTYAKDIIKTKGSNVELVSTWRTKDPGLIELWNETRNKGALITEKLVIDGPFSENIGEGVLNSEIMDEVILCLNYDGKFGLNNMNSYFQNANTGTAVVWRDWKYKVGDHILFNDTDRFSLLYNNLKGRIVQIELFDSRIRFTVDVEIPLTEQDCQNDGIEFIDIIDDVTRIRFDVLDFEEEMADEDRKKAIVPFQLAYAVSIHKAQGLEYRSVKVVIPSSNAEKITHGIFYTAITRAKEKLKIYWSSETMQEVVAGFSVDTSKQKSLAIIKEKLKQDKNT